MHVKTMNLLKNRGAVNFGGVMPVTELNTPLAPLPYEHLAEPLPDGVSHVADLPGSVDDTPRTAQDFLAGALKRLVDLMAALPDSKSRLQPLIDKVSQAWNESSIEAELFAEYVKAAEAEHEATMAEGKKQSQIVERCVEKVRSAYIALVNAAEERTASRNELTTLKQTRTLPRWFTKSDVQKREAEIESLRQRYETANKAFLEAIAAENRAQDELAEEKRKLQVLDIREQRLALRLRGESAVDPGLGLGMHSDMPDEIALREGI